jgi:hypothetical protein
VFGRVASNRFTFTANSELLEVPATMEEELEAIRQSPAVSLDLHRKMRAKVACYERYRAYIKK